MSKYISTMPPWPAGLALPAGALTFFYDPTTDQEYRLDPARLGNAGQVVPRRYAPAIADWQVGELMVQAFGDTDYFFTTAQAGGPFPAPQSANDNDTVPWQPAAPPVAPTALYATFTLSYLQQYGLQNGAVANLVPGRAYGIRGGWNGGASSQLVVVQGLPGGLFDAVGTLVTGATRTQVQVDVAAGTATAALGSGYSDAQARAAQLNRTAPAGTTVILLTAESPVDYGTAASGTFTVDATGCAVGKCARFALAAGAGAPAFANAPAGQPYRYIGAPYASGKAFRYSLLVCVDCIEVVVVAS